MTALGNAELRQLALNVLEQHAGPGAGAAALASAAHRAYGDLARVAVPLIGQAGMDALTNRALHLAQRDGPGLVEPGGPDQDAGRFAQFILSLEREDPAAVTQAAATVFATLTGLLVTFIGEPLTAGLLRKSWPGAFPTVSIQES